MAINVQPRKLLYSYLATEMLAPFFASFLIINCVFFLVKLIPFLNFVLDLEIGFADFARLFSYLFPNIFLYTLPMAAMLGVTIGFARLSSDSEILALKASGISVYKMIPPVVLVTALIALFTSYFSIRLIPLSEIAMKQLTFQLLREKASKGIKAHDFTEALGDVVVYVDEIDKTTEQWSKVWVSDMRDGAIPTITMAATGRMDSSLEKMNISLILNNGSLHKPEKKNAQIVEFDRYQLNLPLAPPQTKATRMKKRDVLGMRELLLAAEQTPEDNRNNIREKRQFLIEFHKRLVLPAGCMLISLLGLPLGLQARAGKKAIGIQAGLGIFIIYYILFTYGKSMAEDGVLPVAASMWLPNILFFLLALFWISRVAAEKSLIPAPIAKHALFLQKIAAAQGARLIRLVVPAEKSPDGKRMQRLFRLRRRRRVRGNPKQRIFHIKSCRHFKSPECTLTFKDQQTALDSGFSPCKECLPEGSEQKKQRQE